MWSNDPPAPRGTGAGSSVADRVMRTVLVLVGAACVAWGLRWLIIRIRPLDWWQVLRWGLTGLVVNDGLVAPTALLLGLLLRHLSPRYRWPLRSGLLAVACLSILLLIAAGARRYRQDRTVLPTDPADAAVIMALGLVITLVLVEGAVLVHGRRTDRRRDR